VFRNTWAVGVPVRAVGCRRSVGRGHIVGLSASRSIASISLWMEASLIQAVRVGRAVTLIAPRASIGDYVREWEVGRHAGPAHARGAEPGSSPRGGEARAIRGNARRRRAGRDGRERLDGSLARALCLCAPAGLFGQGLELADDLIELAPLLFRKGHQRVQGATENRNAVASRRPFRIIVGAGRTDAAHARRYSCQPPAFCLEAHRRLVDKPHVPTPRARELELHDSRSLQAELGDAQAPART
jgi:hypothetical protein